MNTVLYLRNNRMLNALQASYSCWWGFLRMCFHWLAFNLCFYTCFPERAATMVDQLLYFRQSSTAVLMSLSQKHFSTTKHDCHHKQILMNLDVVWVILNKIHLLSVVPHSPTLCWSNSFLLQQYPKYLTAASVLLLLDKAALR